MAHDFIQKQTIFVGREVQVFGTDDEDAVVARYPDGHDHNMCSTGSQWIGNDLHAGRQFAAQQR